MRRYTAKSGPDGYAFVPLLSRSDEGFNDIHLRIASDSTAEVEWNEGAYIPPGEQHWEMKSNAVQRVTEKL